MPNIEGEIDDVILNLKYCVLIDNKSIAKDKLSKIEKLQEELSNMVIHEKKSEKNFNLCKSNRIKNPSKDLGIFQTITRGIFNEKNRNLFKEYNQLENIYNKAKENYINSMDSVKKKHIKIESREKKLHESGYPINQSEFDQFIDFLLTNESDFLKKYPFFNEIRAAHTPF